MDERQRRAGGSTAQRTRRMRVATWLPEEEVGWQVAAGPPQSAGPEVPFLLSPADEHTGRLFGRRHWPEAVEFTAHGGIRCATLLLSLRDLSRPAPGVARRAN